MLDRLEPLASSPAAYAFVVVLGLLWGSFANVCIYRWPPTDEFPAGRSVVTPGSHCFACKAPFSGRYLIVEAATGALFGVAWWAAVVAPALFESFDDRLLHFAVYAAFCFVMVVITFIDLDHKLILNKVTIPATVVFYAASFLWPERRWYDGVVGAAIGYGLPWAIGEIYYRITRREGLGLGDGMLLALVGALLGWRGVLVALFGGSMIGSVIGISALLIGRAAASSEQPAPGAPPASGAEPPPPDVSDHDRPSLMRAELPFGPFLAIAASFYLFAEPWIHLHFHLPGG